MEIYDYKVNGIYNIDDMYKEVQKSVIIFDGECNLCNGVIGWLLQFAPPEKFSFVPFQSPIGQEFLKANGFPLTALETVILWDKSGYHTHSDGFLRIVAKIPKWQLIATLFALVPKIIRDSVYVIAAKNRVRWFGKSQSCAISFQ